MMAPPEKEKEEYLGDAVYASFDGFSVWLRTGDGNNQRICLEPTILRALVNFAKGVDKQYGVEHFFKKEA